LLHIIGFYNTIFWLIITLGTIGLNAVYLTSSVQSACDNAGISAVFVTVIILPTFWNSSEIFSAIIYCMKGKMNLALKIAIESSTQILVFIIPFVVTLSWMYGTYLSLNFGSLSANALLLSVITATFAIKDGKSTWLLGFMLIVAYLMVVIGYICHNNNNLYNSRAVYNN